MKIIKRNGAEVPFDITKIITAVTKASDSVGGKSRLTREQITQIADGCDRPVPGAQPRRQRGRDPGYGGEPADGHPVPTTLPATISPTAMSRA